MSQIFYMPKGFIFGQAQNKWWWLASWEPQFLQQLELPE